jgi:CBS domain-containing protein
MDTSVSALMDALQQTKFKGFPVVTNSGDDLVVGAQYTV